jgi:hypothetical protein
MALEPFETAEAHSTPTVRQQSVFVENRVGQLLRLTRLFDRTDIRILAISIVYSVDCAICRMILNDPDKGDDILRGAGFHISDSELLVISLPHGKRALLHTWAALLGAEINIHYTYPLLIRPHGTAAIALAPDDLEGAVRILRERKFDVLSQDELLEDQEG